jgi:hypothetical protein
MTKPGCGEGREWLDLSVSWKCCPGVQMELDGSTSGGTGKGLVGGRVNMASKSQWVADGRSGHRSSNGGFPFWEGGGWADQVKVSTRLAVLW